MRQRHGIPRWTIPLLTLSLTLCFIGADVPAATSYADTFPILGVVHTGRAPEALAVDSQTHLLYIAHESPGTLVAFDPVRGVVRWRLTLGDVVTDVQVDSQSHRVYAAVGLPGGRSGALFLLDGLSGRMLWSAPIGANDDGIALDIARRRVYVSDNRRVEAFTLAFPSSPDHFQASSQSLTIGSHPEAVGVDSQLGHLYVADGPEHTVRVIDEESYRTLATITVATMPLQPLRVDEAKGRVYVACSQGQELDVIDANTNRLSARIPTAPAPEGIAFHTATGQVYIANEGDDGQNRGHTLTVLDGQSLNVLGTLQVGLGPDGVESDPSLHRVYVALEGSDALVEVSDSPNLPFAGGVTASQVNTARETAAALRQATLLTIIALLATVVLATLSVLSPRWRGRGSPRTQLGDASSRSTSHSLPR